MCLWEMKRSRRLLETSPPQNTSHPWTEWQFFSSESTLFFCSSLLALWRSVSINLRVLALDTSHRPCPSSWSSISFAFFRKDLSGVRLILALNFLVKSGVLPWVLNFLFRKKTMARNTPYQWPQQSNPRERPSPHHPSCILACWNGGRDKKIAFDEGFVFIFSTKRWYLCQNWPTYWSLNLT